MRNLSADHSEAAHHHSHCQSVIAFMCNCFKSSSQVCKEHIYLLQCLNTMAQGYLE